MKFIILSGSLRKESFTTKLARAFIEHLPAEYEVNLIDISQLPFINEDLEADLPQPVRDLHTIIRAADGVIFATPEYNRSYSPVLKNAIDWGSRPDGENAWEGLPAGVIGSTLYNLGTFGAQQHLRQVLMYLDMPTLQQPEFYLEKSAAKFAADGTLTDEHTKEKIDEFWAAFIAWAHKNRRS
jgi:chromate reductase, NAD(P)H dehydrogenase (quinone)